MLAALFGGVLSGCVGPGMEPPGAEPPGALSPAPGAAVGSPSVFGNSGQTPEMAVTPPSGPAGSAAGPQASNNPSGMGMPTGGAAGTGTGQQPTTTPMSGAGGTSGSAGSASGPLDAGGLTAGCVALRAPARQGLHLVVDESVAMLVPNDLWSPLGEALDAFVVSDQASHMELGVQFFQGACDPSAYAQPTLPMAPAGGQQAALDAAMSTRTHGPGAATTLALQGALDQAQSWAMSSKASAGVLLISGSEPMACAGSAATAASAAANGLSGTPAVPTYVIALHARTSLDGIARAGGTGASLAVSDPAGKQALLDAMQSVAARAACEYALPAEATQYLPDRVNLQLTVGGTTTTVARVTDAQACDPTQGGWYYDDPQSPKRMIACPQTCSEVSKGGNVEIVFGCAGKTQP